MEFTINNNMISKGALGGAVVAGPTAAYIGLANTTTSELFMYTFLGTFLLLVFLHLFFRDENFDKLQAINRTIWILVPWLAFLFLFAFSLGAYVSMFVSLGFIIVFYLIDLMQDILKLEEENAG